MRGLIASLADSPYRVIVSMGPQHEELELAQNMVGEEFLPQTSILPHVDAVITHGGNNTVTEALYFGKPMVLLPVFWDQYDNAQRMHETGFGIRLDTYGHDPAELPAAVERLLGDQPLRERLGALSGRLQAAPGTERAADLIEGLRQALMKWLWTSWKVGWGSPRPAAAALGPMCSSAKPWNCSADSHTSVTRNPLSVFVTQWKSAPGGVGPPGVKPMLATTWSY